MRVQCILAALAILAAPAARAAQPPAAAATDELGAREVVLATPWFTFDSHFGFNLYDAVLTSASARRGKRPDPLHEGECFAALVQEERSAWDTAVAYYSETVAATSDFSRERTVVRTHLAGIELELDDDDRRDLGLSLLFLRAAAPAWRACRWPEQDAANRRWVAELVPRLERHADTVGRRLEKLFARAWRQRPLAVDVVATAGWAGADTIAFGGNTPTHIQISSRNPGYQGPAALEMIFHEASHELVSPRNGPVAELLAAASRETGVEVHRSLWHGLLFVTVGEVVRDVLAAAGEGPYEPVANSVFRGDWKVLHQPLVEHWLPFVRGEIGREEAARRLLTALGKASGSVEPPGRRRAQPS